MLQRLDLTRAVPAIGAIAGAIVPLLAVLIIDLAIQANNANSVNNDPSEGVLWLAVFPLSGALGGGLGGLFLASTQRRALV